MAYDFAGALGRAADQVPARVRLAHERLERILLIDWVYWLVAAFLSATMALWLTSVFHTTIVPPGGDPGNWASTSYIYLGRSYPSQLTPFGYPPLLFPILGAFVAAAGPVAGVQLFAPVLLFLLGLSTAWLVRSALKTAAMAYITVGLLLADPAILDMFFWGAYPNLLAFVFMNLAWVGLLRASRGHPSSGAFQFWIFFSATILTHSLVGLALAAAASLFAGLSHTLSRGSERAAVVTAAQHGVLEEPWLAMRALFQSRGGLYGLLAAVITVGGYYGGTFALGVPHPYYFVSDASAFALIPTGTIFEAIIPHFALTRALVLDVLIGVLVAGGVLFAFLRDRRRAWLTPPAVLLLSWLLGPTALAIGGILLHIVTDYHRFGFLFVVPAGVAVAYVWERAWMLRAYPVVPPGAPGPAESIPREGPARPGGWRLAASRRRSAAVVVGGTVLLVLILVFATAPAMTRDEATFTKVGHDAAFLAAIRAITHSGVRGGILTVAAAEKWTRALTDENTYAPSSPLYLFYPAQATDAQLAYFALLTHYSLTNGRVAAEVHATNPVDADGIPDYAVFLAGTVHPVLRLPPGAVTVELFDPGTGQTFFEHLNTTPVVSLPANLDSPMIVTYSETGFTLTVTLAVDPSLAECTVALDAVTNGPYTIRSVSATLQPAEPSSAYVWSPGGPGAFDWRMLGSSQHPITFGNVTPAGALAAAGNYDPAVGGPAVEIVIHAAQSAGSASVSGSVSLSTPSATSFGGSVPPVIDGPAVWQTLGCRFVLMRNSSYAPNPTVALPDETGYLMREYQLPLLYANAEWSVLELPAAPAG